MLKTITLTCADGSAREVAFKATGATAIRYRQVFGAELLQGLTGIIQAAGNDGLARLLSASQSAAAEGKTALAPEDLDPEALQAVLKIAGSGQLDTISKLAYIMAASAGGRKDLSFDDYLDWLDQFESMEFLTKAMDFISIYMANRGTTSAAKKEAAQLIAK